MRQINKIIIHCSSTPEGRFVTVDEIRDWHTWPCDIIKDGKYLYTKYKGNEYSNRNELPEDVRARHGRGWSDIGYHVVVYLDGRIVYGRDYEKIGAHCHGYNNDSIGICYVGGLDLNGKPKDTRTKAQKHSLLVINEKLIDDYPTITSIKGHRDYSEDQNGNGIIEPFEWMKACPCFDAEEEYKHLLK